MQTTEPKHTPGPWAVSPSSMEVPWSIQAPNGETICNICTGDDERTEMADARLIAAAPDLAAALEETLAHYVSFVNSGDGGHWDPEKEEHVKAARAALAKLNP